MAMCAAPRIWTWSPIRTRPTSIRRGGNVTADTRFGGLDIVQRAVGVPGYSNLEADSVESDLLGVPVRICSLAQLREVKRAAGREQDRADLANLPDS